VTLCREWALHAALFILTDFYLSAPPQQHWVQWVLPLGATRKTLGESAPPCGHVI
jgi:hypothetical protein